MTARESWRFEHQPVLTSQFCSSAYQAGGSILVNFSMADASTTTRVLGLNASHQVAFELSYVNTGGCNTSWNAVPVPFDQLVFD